jgi:two-component system, OmpR family, sensor kinase
MTLRLRLIIALTVLLAAGLALFGAATYLRYRQSEYQRLDAEITGSEPSVDSYVDRAAGFEPSGGGPFGVPGSGGLGPPAVVPPPGTYAELRDATGAVVPNSRIQFSTGTALPRLPTKLPRAPAGGRFFTVGSTTRSGGFRVLIQPVGQPTGGTIVVAEPTTAVTKALHGLVLDEVAGGAILLVLMSAGSFLVLRRGLRPLERMAGTARSITAGDLSQRVAASGAAGEVGELGVALNTMLEDIEAAFQERDATELRLRQFLADASHELRTPLTSIQGFAELFRVGGDDARVDLPTILRRIEEESARMKVLVEDLLLLARLDQPRAAERTPVDLAVLAADACSDAVATAPDRFVTLDAPEPVVIAGDQAHLRQAIANLVTNATRHTPPGTPIEVAARLVDGIATVSVRDHGPGLDDEQLAHAFDRFWQADKARVGTGAGLGLAIVSSIAAAHGGSASAANDPGGGAVFTIRLPVDARAAEPRQVRGGTEPNPRLL